MERTEGGPLRRWHIITFLCTLAGIAVALALLTWAAMKEIMGGPYRVPGSLTDEAEAYILAGKDGEVLSCCARYLAYHPTDAQAKWYRAVALHRLGRKEEAEQQFKEISGIDTNWADVVRAYPRWLKSDARWTIAPPQTPAGDVLKAAPEELPDKKAI